MLQEEMYDNYLMYLNGIEGKLSGVRRMIEKQRYFFDIATELNSIRSSIRGLEISILNNNLRECVNLSFTENDPKQREEKIEEILRLLKNLSK